VRSDRGAGADVRGTSVLHSSATTVRLCLCLSVGRLSCLSQGTLAADVSRRGGGGVSRDGRSVGAACRRRPQRRYITASRAAAARRPARPPRSSLLLYIAVDEGRISVAVTATAAFPSRLVQSESMHRAAVQVDCQFAIVVKHFPRIWNGLPACHIFTNISTKTESTLFYFDDLTRTLCCSPVVFCGPSFGLLRFSDRPLAGLICTVHLTGCTTGCKV